MNRDIGLALLLGAASIVAPSSRAADVYTIDSMHSMPAFAYRHLDFSTFRGRFGKTSGVITLDPAMHSGTADVTVDVGSVDTGVPMLDEFLKSPKFFDAAKFPLIKFKSTSFGFAGEQLTSVTGDLTIHGVTRQVKLEVTFFACHQHQLLKVPACGADARVTIRRSDFGLSMFIPNDADEVELEIGVEALRKDQPTLGP